MKDLSCIYKTYCSIQYIKNNDWIFSDTDRDNIIDFYIEKYPKFNRDTIKEKLNNIINENSKEI